MSASAIDPAAEFAAETARVRERRRLRGRIWIFAALVVLVPTASLFGLFLWTHLEDRRLVAEALDRARAAGDPLTTEEMQALHYPPSQAIDEATEHWRHAIAAAEQVRRNAGAGPRTIGGGAYGRRTTYGENGLFDDATLKLVDELLEGPGEQAIQAAHQARLAGAVARFEGDIPTDLPALAAWTLEHDARELLYELRFDAERAAARGNLEAATEDLLTMVTWSDAHADSLVAEHGYQFRHELYGLACWMIRELIDRVDFSDEQLQRIDAAFAKADFQRELVRLIQVEQYRIVRAFETDEPTADETLATFVSHPFQGAGEARTIHLHQDLLEAARIDLPTAYRAKASLEAVITAIEEKRSAVEYYRHGLAEWRARELQRWVDEAVAAAAKQALMRAGLACERYRLKNGAWPKSLAALVPEFLDQVPIDPVDGQALRYEATGERLAIHSLAQYELGSKNWNFDDGPLTFVIDKPQRP